MSKEMKTTIGVALVMVLVAAFGLLLLRGAWLCDDAFITYRTVENFIAGQGLRWNVEERVQPYTHPLWMLLNAGVFFFTREIFLSGMALAFSVSMLAFSIALMGASRSWTWALLGGLTLVFSRAFMSYSSSGLENPLSHLLLVLFLLAYCYEQWSPRRLLLLSLLASLLVLNRMDALLFVLPPLIYVWSSMRSRRATLALVLGFSPFVAWEVFSLIYYGFPFPNTAYAKLGTGIETVEVLQQGMNYFRFTWQRDPITLPVIFLALLAPLVLRAWRFVPVSLGIALYLLYIVKIGGDFMGGRFFAAPLFMAVLVLMQMPRKGWVLCYLPLFILVPWWAMSAPHAPITITADFGKNMVDWRDDSGVGDEHRFYFSRSSFLAWREMQKRPEAIRKAFPNHSYAETGRKYRRENRFQVKVHGSVGYRGFFGGPSVHIVDYYALADPLLARMPARYSPQWRIGHFTREVPKGYTQALMSKQDSFGLKEKEDSPKRKLGEYYQHLYNIIRAPIWSPSRWKDIVWMNLGLYDDLIDEDYYRFPRLRRMSQKAYRNQLLRGRRKGLLESGTGGVEIAFPEITHQPAMKLALGYGESYQILWMRGAEILGKHIIPKGRKRSPSGLNSHSIAAPEKAVVEGYSAIRVIPCKGAKRCSTGALALLDTAPQRPE